MRRRRRRARGAVLVLLASAPPALPVTLSLPGNAGAGAGASTVVSIQVDDASGMLGTDVVVAFDPAVVTATAVSTTGISSSHALTINLSTPGLVRISLYGAAPLSGAGALLDMSLTSTGPPGAFTTLDLASADLNEGALAVTLLDGGYCVQGVPAEVLQLAAQHVPSSTAALLTWAPHPFAAVYNLYRASKPDLSDLTCFQARIAGTSAQDDGSVPTSGEAVLYLVTAETCAGESSLGADAAGIPRPNLAPCP